MSETPPSRRRFFRRAAAASMGALAAEHAVSAGDAQSVALAGSTYVDARKVLLWESTRKEFREAVEGNILNKVKGRLNIQDPKSAADDEMFHHDARLSTTAKGEAMISIAVTWTADVLRQMIAER